MFNIMMLAVIVAVACGLSACETVKGVGKDITNGGEWVQEKI